MTSKPRMPDRQQRTAAKGILIAAPGSGAGKTTLTLGLLRALKNAGKSVVSAKSGPDYIDPKFHEAASGRPCINLDAWAMDGGTLSFLAHEQAAGQDLLLVEGAMGLFDGSANGSGSAADLARTLGLPVVLVVDCAKQAQSVAALVHGFLTYRTDIRLAGVILNRVGSARHEAMLRAALMPLCVTILGAMPRADALMLPERHLGLVQAGEHPRLETFLIEAADVCSRHIDLDRFADLARQAEGVQEAIPRLPGPLGQKIAVASDIAFDFAYPHLLANWQRRGAEIRLFSPLNDEAPPQDSDAVFLPGGYPELHAGQLAEANRFRTGLRRLAAQNKLIYGECGGFMVLGNGLTDGDGKRHAMTGLLPLETSFQYRKRHLGYRLLTPLGRGLPWTDPLAGHEFHYASILSEGAADPLFKVEDAEGTALVNLGLHTGSVMGSFAHVISKARQ